MMRKKEVREKKVRKEREETEGGCGGKEKNTEKEFIEQWVQRGRGREISAVGKNRNRA